MPGPGCITRRSLPGKTVREAGEPLRGREGGAGWFLAHGLADGSQSTTADFSGLNFAEDHSFVEDFFIPNVRRYGDFVTSIILGRNREVKISGDPIPRWRKGLQKRWMR